MILNSNKKSTKVWITAGTLAALAIGAFWYFQKPADEPPSSLFHIPYSTSTPLPQTYTDPARHFSFNYPEGYKVREISGGENSSRTLVVEPLGGGTAKSGIQIIITADDTNTNITAEIIRQAIPDMKIENPQSFAVGANFGLAFQSDNPAFGGASREVWFISNGFLYQISTYATNDELLKKMFDTWKLF